jgi:hypothetical protein
LVGGGWCVVVSCRVVCAPTLVGTAGSGILVAAVSASSAFLTRRLISAACVSNWNSVPSLLHNVMQLLGAGSSRDMATAGAWFTATVDMVV